MYQLFKQKKGMAVNDSGKWKMTTKLERSVTECWNAGIEQWITRTWLWFLQKMSICCSFYYLLQGLICWLSRSWTCFQKETVVIFILLSGWAKVQLKNLSKHKIYTMVESHASFSTAVSHEEKTSPYLLTKFLDWSIGRTRSYRTSCYTNQLFLA